MSNEDPFLDSSLEDEEVGATERWLERRYRENYRDYTWSWLLSGIHLCNVNYEAAIAAQDSLPDNYFLSLPHPTDRSSQPELISKGLSGIYKRPGTEDEDLSLFWSEYERRLDLNKTGFFKNLLRRIAGS